MAGPNKGRAENGRHGFVGKFGYEISIMKPRDYQIACVQSVLKSWLDGNRSPLAVMPTGCGKTVIAALLMQATFPKRWMAVAHRRELIYQARDRILEATGFDSDIEMADQRASLCKELFSPEKHIVIASKDTLASGGDGGGRMEKFQPDDFDHLWFDEGHHATSPSWRRIKNHFFQNENCRLFGTTATPLRADNESLGQVFDHVAFKYFIIDALNDGWLTPIKNYEVPIEADFSSIKPVKGDLSSNDLAAIMEEEKPVAGVAASVIDIVGDRQGIGYAASVHHASLLCRIFNRPGSGFKGRCAFVHGKTDDRERSLIVSEFRKGNIQWIWNFGVFTEGADFPNAQVLAMARPTKSIGLYTQILGRITRPHSSVAVHLGDMPSILRKIIISKSAKPYCEVIDFADNSEMKLIRVADVLGGNYTQATRDSVNDFIRRKPVDVVVSLEEEQKRQDEKIKRQQEENARRAHLSYTASYKKIERDIFDESDRTPMPIAKKIKYTQELSPKQKKILRLAGYDPSKLQFGYAKILIGRIMERRNQGKIEKKNQHVIPLRA
jgi:superfamily II DNA or RNA helicase